MITESWHGRVRRRIVAVMRALRWTLLSSLALACGAHGGNAPDAARAGGDAAVADASTEAGMSTQAPTAPTWVSLVREERWVAAAAAIDALPDAERKKPDVRFARAAVALRRSDGKAALDALDALEGSLPALAPEIGRARAQAQAIAGPFADAGEWFSKHAASNADHLAAADAFMKAKLPTRATAEAARVLSSERKSRTSEARARAIRMHTGETADAIADARWLLVHGFLAETRDAEAVLAKDDPKHPLGQRELVARARALADEAQLDEALRALDRAAYAPGRVHAVELKRARADAMMRARSRYVEAATLFRQCSADKSDTEAASDLLWSARALSRADHDDEAIARYAEVVARFRKSPEAEAAAFYSARLEMLHGRWARAAAAFDDYASKFAGGANHDEALHLRAIAHFEKGDDVKRARKLLEERAGSERDAVARARMENLAALAALKDGDRTHAIARFTDVARNLPLSWPALVARARLGALSAPLPPAMPAGPADPAAPLVVTLPEAVATLDRIGLDGAAEDALRARESEVTAAAASRSTEALCVAYGKIDRGKRRMQLATQIDAKDLARAPGPSTRWAWSCAYPAPFSAAVRAAEIRETLPSGLVDAVMRQESEFDENAISPARAVGALQLLPETAQTVATELGVRLESGDLTSPARSVALGARYLHDLLVRAHGSVPLAVASYNAGDESVLRWAQRMKGMELDAFVEAIPFAETRAYVVRVLDNFARYGYLERGEAGVPTVELALP